MRGVSILPIYHHHKLYIDILSRPISCN